MDHGDGVETRYYHMSPGSITVEDGQEVKQGVQIGILGNSGNSSAPHLHYEVVVNGNPVDPAPYLAKKD
jgi:murein DD-endopeptidase MepM/ murein hydrolase activator NlpD